MQGLHGKQSHQNDHRQFEQAGSILRGGIGISMTTPHDGLAKRAGHPHDQIDHLISINN